MALACKFGRMAQSIRANGKIIRLMVRGLSGMQMETIMKVSSATINQMATECFTAWMAQSMKVSGSMIFSMDLARLTGLTVQATLATTRRAGVTELEHTSGPMAINTAVSGQIIP